MNWCKITSKEDFIDEIIQICDQASNLDINQGPEYISSKLTTLVKEARATSEPVRQLKLISEALDEFYNHPEDDYGAYLSDFYPKGQKVILFSENTLTTDAKTVSSTFEETAKASRIVRTNNFINSKFPESSNAKLYFQRSIRTDLVETFLVSRSDDNPRYFTSQEEMNKHVREYKQELLDRVFAYFDGDMFLKSQVKDLPRKMYDGETYTGVIKAIKGVIDSRLGNNRIGQHVKQLEDYYKDYRDGNPAVHERAKKFLDAYNAWIMLQDFDIIVKDLFGSIINVTGANFNSHNGDLHKYEIRGRATNMWNNWTTSDDIADMSEVISDVTQALIETSRMYQWGSDVAFTDRYVSFHDFNYVIGKIKKFAFDSVSDTLQLHNIPGIDKVSLHTKRILADILSWNRTHGNYVNGVPKAVTWKQLVSRINENPQRYMHAIFDIMCNTELLKNYSFNDYEKNIIWSFNKEVFGLGNNTRSLYRLHSMTKQDNVYQILTQVAASTFPEDYLQYYETSDGAISTRLLQDYAISNIKNTLFQDIQGTAVTLTQDQYKRFGIVHAPRQKQPEYLDAVKIEIPIDKNLTFTITANANREIVQDYTDEECDLIWRNERVQELIKELLGINFEGDPDLKNAYMELVGSPYGAIQDLSKLLGRIAFNSVLNTVYVPKFPGAQKEERHLKNLIKAVYGEDNAKKYYSLIDTSVGFIPVLPTNVKETSLSNLAMAIAINQNLLAAAQSKTGEGTSLANYTLSRMRNFYQNQVEMQCKQRNSAVRDLSFVVNTNGLFEGILSRREIKTNATTQQSTKFSDRQSFQLAFINDFVAAFAPNSNNSAYIKNGRASFLPTVNSDKSQIDGLLVNLNAKTRIPNGKGGFKTYLELSDSDIETEMGLEFKNMYTRIIDNINTELTRVYDALSQINSMMIAQGKTPFKLDPISKGDSVIASNHALLKAINNAFKDREDLGKKPEERITNGLHKLITAYNKTHTRNPIMLAQHVHYVFDKNGLLTSNKVLEALWGRFNPDMSSTTREYLDSLYGNEQEYLSFLQRNGLSDLQSTTSFFKWQDYLTVKDLLDMNFKVYLRGGDGVVRPDQPEIQFLQGNAKFTKEQMGDPNYQAAIALNAEMRNWVASDGTMIIAKGIIDGKLTNIKTLEQLNAASNLQMHPMLSKLNRLDYLCTQQYTISTVGSHYVHKGKGDVGSVLAEEAERWLASNKRNVAATSTVHLFQNKQLDGVPSVYNMAIIEDVFFDLYNVMGDLYLEGHAPLDGGMMVNAWIPDLENNSLAGEAAGLDKKQFGTFYSELYGAGGIVKTAGFAATNSRMRRQKAWINLQKNMSNRKWVKEFADANGRDILEVLDITKNYFGETIDYTQAIKGQKILYKRVAHDNANEMAAYRLDHIESLGNNQYRIYEVEVNNQGVEIGEVLPRIENGSDIITIDNNWDLFMKVFGGYYSLEIGANGLLQWSENSNKLMVHAINNIGYRKDVSHLGAELQNYVNNNRDGLDQDDIWQPLKYSDIHYTPNIGAIKSLQFNVNPDGEAVLTSETTLNFMRMRLAQLGIQLDKEHHADAAEVSMPTQIIQALANRSYTSGYGKEVYTALSTLARQATEPFLEGIKEIFDGNSPDKLVETVATLIVDNLLHQSGEDSSISAIMKQLFEKAEKGEELSFAEDIKGKIPWSDPTISNKLFSTLSTTLTNMAVKMKFAGSLSVICPTDPIERIYGDRLLSSFTKVTNDDGSTRTQLSETALQEYQNSVANGNEVDSDNMNMLIFDLMRDVEAEIENNPNLSEEEIIKIKLSQSANLKTQHNYIIEFANGDKEEITINTPDDYYRVKNLILSGKSIQSDLIKPLTDTDYDTMYYKALNRLLKSVDINTIEGGRVAVEQMAAEEADAEYQAYAQRIYETYGMDIDAYAQWYSEQSTTSVVKIYEDVQKGRALSAYNVRFTDAKSGHRFQIYDLDSINLLFNLNYLLTDPKVKIKDHNLFQSNNSEQQQIILNKIFQSSAFPSDAIYEVLQEDYENLPKFNSNFINEFNLRYPGKLIEFIEAFRKVTKPYVHNLMQQDLFKLSPSYTKSDKKVFANGRLVDPMDITTSAYELIMPKIYKTQFGLQEHDDLQEILRDKDFFVKRGLSRFECKLSHPEYDYELKNFNGEHYYILDKSKGIPEHIANQIATIFTEKRKNKVYRVDSNGQVIYEMASEEDAVCNIGGVQVIVTDNPLFYVQSLNYNTLKVSPTRVTKDSYQTLIQTLEQSKRANARNYLKAITTNKGEYFSLKMFKEFNEAIDSLNYENVRIHAAATKEFKSVTQLCRIILQNGRELHTAFDESLNLVAGRIPAQSQQSFMAQRVIGFDSSDLNTAMVSTFQLFLQGSDLDIDAVTLLGYDFDKNGKFIGWSPYFLTDSKKTLEASKNIPLPTGKKSTVNVSPEAENNFFEVYNKYFGTLFKLIPLPDGGIKTKNGIPELKTDFYTAEELQLFAEFLRDFNKYGINIRGTLSDDLVTFTDSVNTIKYKYNLTQQIEFGGLGISSEQLYAIAQQLIEVVNRHNEYIKVADEHLRDSMAKNYIVHYIYKTAVEPCNRTEAEQSLDVSTRAVKQGAKKFAEKSGAKTHAPGRLTSKVKMIGEGQAGKEGVGIGAVGIKANSTTQFYISQLWNYGSDWDREKILFKTPVRIAGKTYRGFANMHTDEIFDEETKTKFAEAFEVLDSLTSKDQITENVAENIAAMLSIAVDNAKDLALAKINSGPRLMGMYIYGLTLGIPIQTLIDIMKSDEGMLLKELTEGSIFDGDAASFRVLDVFDKLNGNFGKDLHRFNYIIYGKNDKPLRIKSTTVKINNRAINIKNSRDIIFEAMYPHYEKWFAKNKKKLPKINNRIPPIAEDFGTMLQHLMRLQAFDTIYKNSVSGMQERMNSLIPRIDSQTLSNLKASCNQIISYIKEMDTKIKTFNKVGGFGQDLRVLAEGAEEMRILGSILGINKGLKATMSEAEAFIDTFENLIYNRKTIMGQEADESDRIDFHKFMLDEEYQREVIDAYETVKHSVNIPHLLTKAPHFFSYLEAQMVPTSFFMTASVKYRTMHKYRKNIAADSGGKAESLFKLFEVESKKDKEAVLRGLENLIHHKLFTRWLFDKKFQFKVPKGFYYFTKKGELTVDNESETTINLWTEEGLASFKKYMEEVYIPMLIQNPNYKANEFVKNLTKILYTKTPVHNSSLVYSLNGDLMARKGRQAELNAKMFADFQYLADIAFQPDLGISSIIDAFYIYAQYCYGGKKGQKSLMTLFDNTSARGTSAASFAEHIAMMDTQDKITCSREELIVWCAPKGTQKSKSKWIYGNKKGLFGISLLQRVEDDSKPLTDEEKDAKEAAQDADVEESSKKSKEKFSIYKPEYSATQYDRVTQNYFLVPIVSDTISEITDLPIHVFDSKELIRLKVNADRIEGIQFSENLHNLIQSKIDEKVITKFNSVSEFRLNLLELLKPIHIPYKVSLTSAVKQEMDLGILQTLIEQQIHC